MMFAANFCRLSILAAVLFYCTPVIGGQFLGGEINYRFISRNGNEYIYQLTLKLYRECLNPADLDDPVLKIINSTDLTKNTHTVIYREEVFSNPVIDILPYSSKSYCSINDPEACFERRTYTKQVTLHYSPEGYTFYYTGCCRNGMSNLVIAEWNNGTELINGSIIVPGQGLTYYTKMPSHDSLSQNSNPVSVNDSVIYACKGKQLYYKFSFLDPDGDSLAFRLNSSLAKTGAANTYYDPVHFGNGYTMANPIGGIPLVSLDQKTGILEGVPDITGQFAVAITIEEYREGKLIAESRKDFQVNVSYCEIIKPPDIANCSDNIAQFTNTNNITNNFSWDFGVAGIDSDTSIVHQPIYLYPQGGAFNVKLVVTNPSGCSDSVFCTAKIFPGSMQVDFSWSGEPCEGEELLFEDKTVFPNGSIQRWAWRILNTRATISHSPSVAYTHTISGVKPYPMAVRLVVESNIGCKDSVLKTVLIYENVKADAGPDRILAFDQVYQMQGNSSSAGVIYNWFPSYGLSNPFIRHPEVRANRDIEYTLEVSNEAGCTDSDKVFFRYMKGPDVYVASAFTPNNDGKNDLLHFFPVAMAKADFIVYNRWGQVVFSTSDFSKGWDGKVNGILQDAGVYAWIVNAKDLKGEVVIKKGSVVLIR